MKIHDMMLLPSAFLALAVASFSSCGSCSRPGVGHYDTALVDTMMAVNLDSAVSGDDAYVSAWTYQRDSTVATMASAPNRKSVITASNRMTVRVRYMGRMGMEACLVLGDGEQFAGNSYDSTNFVRVYAQGNEVGRFNYRPGVSKQTDSAFIQNPAAFLDCLYRNRSIKIEATTFTSGTLVYSFDAIATLAPRKSGWRR